MKLWTKEKRALGNEGKISLPIIIAIAAVAVIGVIFIASGALSKGLHKTFDSPKNYFSYVTKQEILGKKDNSIRSVYENLSSNVTKEDQAMEEQVTVTIGDAGQSYLKMFKEMGVDLSWFVRSHRLPRLRLPPTCSTPPLRSHGPARATATVAINRTWRTTTSRV